MRLAQLVDAVMQIRRTAKKSEKVRLLAGTLHSARGGEIELAAFYLSGSLPQGKIGLGWSLIHKAVAVGESSVESLTLRDVDDAINRLAAEQGVGSIDRRITELRRLFSRATPDERRFLSQLLIGEIRQGALEGLLLEAIADAAQLPPSDVRQAFMFAPNIGALARAALEEGAIGIGRFSLRLFTPVAPMLANSAEDVAEALSRLEEAAWEYKLDGARIQVHKGGDAVKIFTRQLQDVTQRLPEIVEWAKQLPVRETVLDGVGWRSAGFATGWPAPTVPDHDATPWPTEGRADSSTRDSSLALHVRCLVPRRYVIDCPTISRSYQNSERNGSFSDDSTDTDKRSRRGASVLSSVIGDRP